MKLHHVNTKNNVLLESFEALIEDLFRGTELDPIQTGFDEFKQTIDKVVADPEGASDEDIIFAIKHYKKLKEYLNEVGPRLADAKKVLDTVKAYKSGDRKSFNSNLTGQDNPQA